MYDAKKRYKQKTKRIYLDFYPTDKDKQMYNFVCEHDNKQGYVKGLIEKDMKTDKWLCILHNNNENKSNTLWIMLIDFRNPRVYN